MQKCSKVKKISISCNKYLNNSYDNWHLKPQRYQEIGIYLLEYKLQSRYYAHFWISALGRCMNSFIPIFQLWVR